MHKFFASSARIQQEAFSQLELVAAAVACPRWPGTAFRVTDDRIRSTHTVSHPDECHTQSYVHGTSGI
eukprot:2412054-Pleurochrysis_carterae.AAC.1